MKNKKSIIFTLVAVLLFSFAMIGCGDKVTPKESAQILWDVKLKEDTSNVKSLGWSEEDGQKIVDASKKGEMQLIKTNFTKAGLKATDEQIESAYKAMIEGCSKNKVTIEEVSKSGDTAEVKITSTYIDEASIDEKAANDALDEIKKGEFTDQNKALAKATELYINNLVDGLKNAEISSETVDKTFTFKKDKNGIWGPEDKTAFFQDIGKMATNQK